MAPLTDSTISPPLIDTINHFSFQLLILSLSLNQSSGVCPLNIYHCLAMVAAGSKDQNLVGFGLVLRFEPSKLDRMVEHVVQLDTYTKTNPAIDFNSASSIWHHPSFILKSPWKDTVQNTFGARVGPLELEPINEWIEKETKGKLKDIVTPGDIANAVLMLVTCLYFKAKWETPFDKRRTQENAVFYGYTGDVQGCAMMGKVEKLEYMENADLQLCILPYLSGDEAPKWKAAVLLPTQPGLDAMREMLTSFSTSSSTLHSLLLGSTTPGASSSSRGPVGGGSRTQKVSLSLPRFSLELSLDLMPALSALGLAPAFKASSDFAPISEGPLMISRVTHDLVIDVNEEGTEMAAVTAVALRKSRARVQVKEMKVDRPFLFVVFDGMTGLVLCSVVVSEIPKAQGGEKFL